ncbi:unnamed protein product [Acanthoscelides obtectus]|uniref:Uncharacterized protein n=1 Tax=Acanthoscelides obtectus TaxID=200917 RepID=A0A9P0LIS1_ACAOB|nr:unnamed protein product [Acanthoscelides obtectus]CAK1679201.1 hypothetical protein AOBTE_LOCUS32168 [Acanthoscelides obtectus]
MDMDLDYLDTLGLEQDKIKIFLQTKLNEALNENDRLNKAINERKHHLESAVKGPEKKPKVTIELLWKKVFAKKFCLGYTINSASDVVTNELCAFFHWNWKSPFEYTVSVYTKNKHIFDRKNHRMQDLKYITVAFNIPSFTQNSVCEISGKLYVDEETSVPFPNITVAVFDRVDKNTVQWTANDNIECLLTAMSCSKSYDVVFILPKSWTVDNAFEIYCELKKISLEIEDRLYYVADKVSTVFDNSAVELHISAKCKTHIPGVIYCVNELALEIMMHHFMTSVKGFQIYLKDVYDIVFVDSDEEGDYEEKFKSSVKKEIEVRTHHGDDDNLINLEQKVNRLYLIAKEREMEI